MITIRCRGNNVDGTGNFLVLDCLAEDVPKLPVSNINNGSLAFLIDDPDGINAFSKFYKFDAANGVWHAQ